MSPTRYKGFTIEAQPHQIQVSRHWTVDLEIHRDGRKQAFSLKQYYPTQREAEAQCKKIGREIINGVFTGWSVDHLRPAGLSPGDQDGHRNRFAGAGSILWNVGIIIVVAIGAVALLSGAFRTP